MTAINKYGYKISINDKEKNYFWKIYKDNSWEPETFEIFNRYIHSDTTYLDIGAWIGPTVLYGAQIAKKVVALEPDKQAFGYLKENIILNAKISKKVTLVNSALTIKTGPITLYTENANSSSSVINPNNFVNHYEISGISIADLFKKYKLTDTAFIKIDIEGYEYKLLPHLISYLTELMGNKMPTIYLSLHLPYLIKETEAEYRRYFPNRLARVLAKMAASRICKKLENTLNSYSYFLDITGKIVKERSSVFKEKGFTSFVATNISPNNRPNTP